MNEIEPLVLFSFSTLLDAIFIFLRVLGMMLVVPGFGASSIPVRVRIGISIAISMLLLPLLKIQSPQEPNVLSYMNLILTETMAGLFIGLMLRIMVLSLQTAGTIAAQSVSFSHMLGVPSAEPMPAIGHFLMLGGIALLMSLGFHVKIVNMLVISYEVMPVGQLLANVAVHNIGVTQVSNAFTFAFGLAAPYLVVSLLYNVVMGAVNKAMPQLMVYFVGAPGLIFVGLIVVFLSSPNLFENWVQAVSMILKFDLGIRH